MYRVVLQRLAVADLQEAFEWAARRAPLSISIGPTCTIGYALSISVSSSRNGSEPPFSTWNMLSAHQARDPLGPASNIVVFDA